MTHPRVLIIAEAGVNHNGDLDMAKRLIEAAAAAGADMVKFQTFSADRLATRDARKANYQTGTTDAAESQHSMLKRLELSDEMHVALMKHCREHGIAFFSAGFDTQSVDYLNALGIEDIKIPSGELTNLPYLRHVGSLNRRVFLSTGMAGIGEIEAAVEALESAGTPRSHIIALHCNTEYPTPMEDVNLLAMRNIGKVLGVAVGYSDHTPGIEVPIAAAALGARVIEKHFTLDRSLPGPDHLASLEPQELAAMVRAIRNIEAALGDGIKRPSPSELKNRPIARKSLVAAVPIQAGERFSPANLSVKRPGHGISPMRWDEIVGRTAPRDFAADELIEL
jgi:N,N'-diacetyllegionaminate synthase